MIRQELTRACLEKGTELVQAIANAVFALPSTDDPDGPIVRLPPPTTTLPREKHVCFVALCCFLRFDSAYILRCVINYLKWAYSTVYVIILFFEESEAKYILFSFKI